MADDGLEPVDVTGRWVGFYRYPAEEAGTFPIVAEFQQDGGRISGEMYDQITDQSDTLERILDLRRDELSLLQRSRVQTTIKRLGPRSMVVTTRLPDTSDIDGTIKGAEVQFTKAYRGPAVYASTIDGQANAVRAVSRHKVHYAGHLDREQGFIFGQWIIWRRGILARIFRLKNRGTFELYKKS